MQQPLHELDDKHAPRSRIHAEPEESHHSTFSQLSLQPM